MADYLTFKRFNTPEEAKALADFLLAKGIRAEIENESPTFDVTFSGSQLANQFSVKIPQDKFNLAHAVMEEGFDADIDTVDKEYYLFGFSDDELIDILVKPDEWSVFDYNLSKKILAGRGRKIDNHFLEALKRQRIKDLAKPEERQKAWIAAGYIFAILGGAFAIFIGWYLMTFKKTLPNGEQVYAYQEKDRVQGKNIMILGIAMLILYLYLEMRVIL